MYPQRHKGFDSQAIISGSSMEMTQIEETSSRVAWLSSTATVTLFMVIGQVIRDRSAHWLRSLQRYFQALWQKAKVELGNW